MTTQATTAHVEEALSRTYIMALATLDEDVWLKVIGRYPPPR
jgi:hypothetical protein